LDMPRGARIHVPGELHHVMVRGIERGAIFQDDQDRRRLLDRISGVFQEERVECYAWAFLTNHVHLSPVLRK